MDQTRRGKPVREHAADAADAAVAHAKPRLRGALHAVTAPTALVAGVVLVVLAPTASTTITAAVFTASAVLLFGTSAIYHRGTWSPPVAAVLRRLDHASIFVLISGTYTPLAVILLPASTATVLLVVVWVGALGGILARVFWMHAPRWFYVPIYLALGWVAVWFLPAFYRSGGPAVLWLIMAGGLAYTLGALVYALKWPNPSPRWFGFHEIFHVGTVIGYVCHYIAVAVAIFSVT